MIDKFLLEYQDDSSEEQLSKKIEDIRLQVDKIVKAEFLLPFDEKLKTKCYNKIVAEYKTENNHEE